MDTKRWTSLNTILDEALEKQPKERIPFVKQYSGLSEEIRQDAISFLKAIHKSDNFWDRLIESNSELIKQIDKDDFGTQNTEKSNQPEQIGPYKILRKIASGGMGNVYLAERSDGHLQITVALKLIRRECIDYNHIHQFNTERNILGRLNHPYIARIYDGGITEYGRPYLVMEYVEGQSVTDYCNSHRCNVDRKLQLVEQICEGVNFAHSNLVVHRDLKPDNIFVTPNGKCKILDFGIAKIIDPHDTASDTGEYTHELKPFSICHAAPEQLSDGSITTATDVYALGLLLYELLTGTLPYNLKGKTPQEAIHTITESSPPLASSKVIDNAAAGKLKGDLDDILNKALSKDPSDRYQSAGDLLSDIRNYRENLPISIKHNRQLYKLKKFTVRNHAVLLGVAGILILLSSLTIYYVSTIKTERQKAIAEEQQASFIAGFMVDLFDASDPVNNISDTLTVYDILQSGVDKLDNWEASELSKADIMISLGNAYKKIGDYEQSHALLESAFDTYVSELGDSTAPKMINPTLEFAELHKEERNFGFAAHYYDHALSIAKLNQITDPKITTDIYAGFGNTVSELGNPQLAIINLNKALNIARTADLPDTYIRTIRTKLAQAYRGNQEYQKSESLYKELLYSIPADDPTSVEASLIHNNLGFLMKVQEKFEDALFHYNRALDITRIVYGKTHPNTKVILNNLSALYASMEQFDRAEKIWLELLEINTEVFGELHWRTGAAYEALGILKIQSGQLEISADYFESSAQIYLQTLGMDHIWTNRAKLYNSLCRLNTNADDLARNQFEEAFLQLKENRSLFSRYDVEMIHNLIRHFESYRSISSTPEFAQLEDIR